MEALNESFREITQTFFFGFSRVRGTAYAMIMIIAGVQFAFIIWRYTVYGKSDIAPLHLLVKVVVCFIAVQNFPTFMRNIIWFSANIGAAAGGTAVVSEPAGVILVGLNAADPLLRLATSFGQGGRWWEVLSTAITNIGTSLTLYIAYLIVLACYILITLQYIMAYIEFNVVAGIGILFLPFGVLKETKFMTEKFTGSVIGHAIKILLLQFIIGTGIRLFANSIVLSAGETIADISINEDVLPLIINSIIFATLAMSIPSMATGILSGTPTLSSQSIAQTAVAGTAAAGAAGRFAGSTGRGAIAAGAGGANVAGGITKAVSAGNQAAKAVLAAGGEAGPAVFAGLKAGGGSLTKSISQGAKNAASTAWQRTLQTKQQRAGQSLADLHKKTNPNSGINQLSQSQSPLQHFQQQNRQGAIQGRRVGKDEIKRMQEANKDKETTGETQGEPAVEK